MENPFKKLNHPPKKVPDEMRQKVLDDVDTFKLFAEMASLFSNNYASVAESFFKNKKNKNQ